MVLREYTIISQVVKSLVAQLVTSSWCVYDIQDSNSSSILLDYQKKKKKNLEKFL